MKLIKTLLFLVLILIIGALIYVAVQPNNYSVTRTKTINAPVDAVYNNVIDFKNWEHWSSWVEKDPTLVITYPEKTKGVGGHYSWEDSDGVGVMKTLATVEKASIDQEMQFGEFEPSKVHWIFKPHANGTTEVTWTMTSDNMPFGFKAFAVSQGGMDNIIGPHFDRGLEKLDSIMVIEAEKLKATAFRLGNVKEVEVAQQKFIGYKQTTSINGAMDEMTKLFMEFLPKAGQYAATNLQPGKYIPGTVYTKWDEETNEAEFYIGLMLKKNIAPAQGMTAITLPKSKAISISKFGNYGIGDFEAHTAIDKYIKTKGLSQGTIMWELYVNDPGTVKPKDIQTDIYYALKN